VIGVWLTLAAVAAEPHPPAAEPSEPVLDAVVAQVRAMAEQVSEARGLPLPEPLDIRVQTPAQVRQAARDELDEPWAEEDLDCAQAQLVGLGVVAPDFDLRAATEAVQEAAVAGYFDAEIDRLVVVAREDAFVDGAMIRAEDRLTATHELVHAAQDAAFDLYTLRHRDMPTSDIDLALRGLVEGDATWWMIPLSAGQPAEGLRAVPTRFIEQMATQDPTAEVQDPAIADLPPLLRADLVSPYIDGMLFAHTLQVAGGTEAVDAAFRDLPLSTEQILHPERYLQRDVPQLLQPDVPARALGPGWSAVCDDGLGERLLRALFEEVPGVDAIDAAAGWDGDRIRTLRHHDGRIASLHVSVWDSAQDAHQAARAFEARPGEQTVLHKRDRVAVVRGLGKGRGSMKIAKRLLRAPARPLDDLAAVARPRPSAPSPTAPTTPATTP